MREKERGQGIKERSGLLVEAWIVCLFCFFLKKSEGELKVYVCVKERGKERTYAFIGVGNSDDGLK